LPTTNNQTSSDILPTSKILTRQINYYLKSIRIEVSQKTIDLYTHVLYRFADFVKHDVITPSDIRMYLAYLQESGLKPHSIHAHYRSLRTYFKWMVNEDVYKESEYPMKHVKPPRLPKYVIKIFSVEELQDILLACSGRCFRDVRNRAMVLILLDTGIRLAELAGLKMSDINSEGDLLTVYGKGAKERSVRIGYETQKALTKYIMLRGDSPGILWESVSRTPLTISGVQSDVRKLCARAGIKDGKRGPHRFRHTAAKSFVKNGGNVYVLQVMLGHADQQTTRQYCSSIGIDDVIEEHEKFSPVDRMKIK